MTKTEAEKKNTSATKQRVLDYQTTFSTVPGKRVLADLFRAARVFGPVFNKDPLEMAKQEGMRILALRILTHMKADLRKLDQMLEAIENAQGDMQ